MNAFNNRQHAMPGSACDAAGAQKETACVSWRSFTASWAELRLARHRSGSWHINPRYGLGVMKPNFVSNFRRGVQRSRFCWHASLSRSAIIPLMELLDSPLMIMTFVIVLLIEASSLLVLLLLVQIFRTKSAKYRALCRDLGGHDVLWGRPGRILVPLYSLFTVLAAILSVAFFILHPHLS